VDAAAVTVDEVRDDARRARDATMIILLRGFLSSREGGRRGERVDPRVGTTDSSSRGGCGWETDRVELNRARLLVFFSSRDHETDGNVSYE
jgi:hypothetical protein